MRSGSTCEAVVLLIDDEFHALILRLRNMARESEIRIDRFHPAANILCATLREHFQNDY